MPTEAKKSSEKSSTTSNGGAAEEPKTIALTRYVVQQKHPTPHVQGFDDGWFDLPNPHEPSERNGEPNPDLYIFEAENGRKAVQAVMTAHQLEVGDFRAVPEASSKVHSARVKTTTSWA